MNPYYWILFPICQNIFLYSINIINYINSYETYIHICESVQFSRLVFATPWTAAHQAFMSLMSSQSLLKLMSVELMMPSNHIILCLCLLLPSIFPRIRVFSYESVLCIRWPKYWSFSFSISPSNEYSGLISFRMDWLDLHAVQGLSRVFSVTTVQKHQFFGAQLSCIPTVTSIHDHWKNHSLD